MWSLFIISSHVGTASRSLILLRYSSNRVSTYILWWLSKSEERVTVRLLLWSSCGNITSIASWKSYTLTSASLGPISHEWFIVCVQFQLLCQLLLGHIKSLMMHISLIRSSSKIRWKMVFHIDYLSHIFHLMTHSLSLMAIATSAWSEWSDTVCQVLVLRCWTVPLECVKIELILIWSTTDWSFIYLMGTHLALFFIIDNLSRISYLVKLASNIHWVWLSLRMSNLMSWRLRRLSTVWLGYLCVISSGLWTTLDLILDLLCLFLIGFSYGYTLTNLLLLRSIEWMHLMMRLHNQPSSTLWWRILIQVSCLRIINIDIRIIDSVARAPLGWWRSITSLSGGDPSLPTCLRFTWINLIILRWNISLILLLLKHHLLLNLLFMELLGRCKVEVVDYIRDICNSVCTGLSILTGSIGALRGINLNVLRRLVLTLETILNYLSWFVVDTVSRALESFMRLSLLSTVFKILII